MEHLENEYEQIESYCNGTMTPSERVAFNKRLQENENLQQIVTEYSTILTSFSHHQNKTFIKQQIEQIHTHQKAKILPFLSHHIAKYWRTASVAASVAIIASTITFSISRSIYKKENNRQLQLLRNDINIIKQKQKAIIKQVDSVTQNNVPDYPSKYAGTGFAISTDGYLLTNLHVVGKGNKIFTFTPDGIGHQTTMVSSDPENDIAILKIQESNFSFGKNIPYFIKSTDGNLSQRVFTLGYPKGEIVYNEGYISSLNGFDNDTAKFQLELPSSPGVSGAPLVDETGAIIGMINSKESLTEGVTFAIKSNILRNLIRKLPEEFPHHSILNTSTSSNTRTTQIKKMQPYICIVKVYN